MHGAFCTAGIIFVLAALSSSYDLTWLSILGYSITLPLAFGISINNDLTGKSGLEHMYGYSEGYERFGSCR